MIDVSRESMIAFLSDKLLSHDSCMLSISRTNLETIIALLKQPTLPEEPTEEMLEAMRHAWITTLNPSQTPPRPMEGGYKKGYTAEYKALYAALSTPLAPKTKRVKVWRVEWYDNIDKGTRSKSFHIPDQAYDEQKYLKLQEKRKAVSCINLIEDTQEVPDNG